MQIDLKLKKKFKLSFNMDANLSQLFSVVVSALRGFDVVEKYSIHTFTTRA